MSKKITKGEAEQLLVKVKKKTDRDPRLVSITFVKVMEQKIKDNDGAIKILKDVVEIMEAAEEIKKELLAGRF